MIDFNRNCNPLRSKQIIRKSMAALILTMVSIISIPMNGYAANTVNGLENDAENLNEYELKSIGIVTAPKMIKIGDETAVTIKLTGKLNTSAMLRCDFHYRNAKGGGFLAAPPAQKIQEKQIYVFKEKIPTKEGMFQIIPVIYISPDGNWKNKMTDALGQPIKVIPASVAEPEQILSASYPMSSPEYPKIKIGGRKEQILSGEKVWTSVGPGFLNVPMNVHIDGDNILMLIDIGGLIRSIDGGKSWTYLTYSLEGGVAAREFYDFDVNPNNPQEMVISGAYIYSTNDGGKTWRQAKYGLPEIVFNQRHNIYGKIKYTSNGETIFSAVGSRFQDTFGWVAQVIKRYQNKTIYYSRDNGISFSKIEIPGKPSVIAQIYPHPLQADTVYFSFTDGTMFMTRNANAENPRITPIEQPRGYYTVDFSFSPSGNDLLLAMNSIDRKKNACVYRLSENKLNKIPLNVDGKEIALRKIQTISCNPNKTEQVVIGLEGNDYLLISNNDMKHFQKYHLPKRFYAGDVLGHFYGQIERVYFGKSPIAVVVSRIGAWATDNNFSSLYDLSMTYGNGTFGNRGVGSPANINNIAVTKNICFFSAQDHGAWRSAGNNFTSWIPITGPKQKKAGPMQKAPWGQYTWFWRVGNIFSSNDASVVYICCNALMNDKKNGFWSRKKIMRSHDQGETWQDVTANLGMGDVFPEGNTIVRMIFDPKNSERQWLLMSNMLFYTEDGGAHFLRLNPPAWDEKSQPEFKFSDIAYDAGHKILYLASKTNRLRSMEKLNHDKIPAALYRSFDDGKNWHPYDVGQHSIAALGVTESGSLAIGTLKAADQPARLVVIPWGEKYRQDMIRLTVGDSIEEISYCQIEVAPVVCDGEDILAYSNNAWILADRTMAQGPLLSQDGGKTFKWIVYNLPITNIWSADMKYGKIFIGTTVGLMYWKYK